jgi:hypothetical protein
MVMVIKGGSYKKHAVKIPRIPDRSCGNIEMKKIPLDVHQCVFPLCDLTSIFVLHLVEEM